MTSLLRAMPVLLSLLLPTVASAASTSYPLTVHNCGRDIVFDKAPARAVSLGQSNTEILLALGLADRLVGTAVWFGPVLPGYEAANARIRRLADNDPSFEAVVGQQPDLVTVQYEGHVGPNGSVAKPQQFADLGIPVYVSPSDCVAKDNTTGGDGVRRQLFSMELIYQEIGETAAIFDVADAGARLIATLRQREAKAIASIAAAAATRDVPVVFWFSSRDVKGDAFVAGRNGVPAYILSALGDRNVITTNEEWPMVSWERIVAANPAVIVIARMDRRRFPADDVDVKLNFLRTDPVVSQMEAARKQRVVVMDAQSMNPTMRTIDGIEVLAAGITGFGLE